MSSSWFFRSSSGIPIVIVIKSIHPLAAEHSLLFSHLSQHLELSQELSLCIMCLKYDNLILVICTLSKSSGIIYSMIHLFVLFCSLSVVFSGVFSYTKIQKLQHSILFFQSSTFTCIELQRKSLLQDSDFVRYKCKPGI